MLTFAPVSDRPLLQRTESQPACFVCGQSNSGGLRIRFQVAGSGLAKARWKPGKSLEGFPGIVHGGIVATLLDEAMSKAVSALGVTALTAELRVRFRRPVPSGQELAVEGWVLDRRRRRIIVEAAVTGGDGGECAHGWGTFLATSTPAGSPEQGSGPL